MSAVAIPILPAIRLKHILYTTDFSEPSRAALPIVAAIARRYGSHIFAAHIRSTVPPYMPVEALSALEDKNESDAREMLDEFAGAKELEGVSVTAILKCGDVARELNRVVQQQHIDLAVLSTHGRSGFKRLLMGSIAEKLFRNLSCPVLAVGPKLSKRFRTLSEIREILFPTDLSLESRAVFPYLAMVAAEYSARITILHVAPWNDRRHPAAMDEPDAFKSAMNRMFSGQIDPRCEIRLLVESGDPAERILAHACADKIDLIGFGVRKSGEITTHFRNTIPYKVVLESECPVLNCHSGDGW
jgi:nucleotide-binding universal stress UspA family protein